MLPCDICGKAGHSWFDCPKRSTKPADWKPERMRKAQAASRIASHQRGKSVYVEMRTEAALNAGKTVATISRGGVVEVRGPGAAKDITPMARAINIAPGKVPELVAEISATEGDAFSINPPKRAPGRPKSIEDMRSYKAAKQREYRQRLKASKPAEPLEGSTK